MDAATRLIAELHNKLAELDHKVLLYRRDMAAQFERFSEELLHDQPANVSQSVNEAVRERFQRSALAEIPEDEVVKTAALEVTEVGAELSKALAGAGDIAAARKKPPSEIVLGIKEGEDDVPRSPHARENEFLGVFTQEYLPLLDSDKQHEKRSSSAASSRSEDTDSFRPQSAQDQALGLSASYSPPRGEMMMMHQELSRRNTGDSATLSDPEGTPKRRSALRRSSSSGKSPGSRKVRFELSGVEFPTTSSPTVAETPLSAAMATEQTVGGNIIDEDMPSSEMVEDVSFEQEEEEVAPRRISSSQRLRMLSRGPMEDDGTTWEEVVAPQDGSASIAIRNAQLTSDDEEEFLSMRPRKSPSPPKDAVPTPDISSHVELELTPEEKKEEEDILADMTPLMPMHSTRTMMGNNASQSALQSESMEIPSDRSSLITPTTMPPVSISPSIPATTTTAASTTSNNAGSTPAKKKATFQFADASSSDDEDPFYFEDEGDSLASPTAPTRSAAPPDDAEDSSSESESPMSPERTVPASLSAYATSPARAICPPAALNSTALNTWKNSLPSAALEEEEMVPKGDAASASASNAAAGSVGMSGSLRTFSHPWQVPVVSNEVQDEARRLGDVSSFVGSVRGTTGLDEWTGAQPMGVAGRVGSLRGDGRVASGSLRNGQGSLGEGGGPMSFSERFAIEEAMEAERERGKRRGSRGG